MEELNNYLIVFEILGLQYFSLKSLFKVDTKKTKSPSWFRLLYMIFTIIVSFIILRLYGNISGLGLIKALHQNSIIALAVQNIMVLAFIFAITISIIHAYITTKKTKQIFVISSKIKKLCMEAFGKSVDVKALKKKLFRRTRSMAMYFSLFHLLMLVCDQDSLPVSVLVTALKNFILITLSFRLIFYTSLVNEHLNFLEEMVQELFPSPPIKIIDNIHLHLTFGKTATIKDTPLKKIMVARKMYCNLIEITNLVNETVGLSIFLLFISLVITMTSGGYRFFVASMGGPGGETLYGKRRASKYYQILG